MSERQHTPEMWTWRSLNVYDSKNDRLIAGTMSESDAERIVACVNACSGVPTDALAPGAVAALVEAAERRTFGPPSEQSKAHAELIAALAPFRAVK